MESIKPKLSLPHGWQAQISKTYPNKVYYFNSITGHSTWQCPKLVPETKLCKKEDAVSSSCSISGTIERRNMKNSKSDFPVNSSSQFKKKKVSSSEKSGIKEVDSRKCASISTDISKSLNPPTAVVVPVVHKPHKENSSVLKKFKVRHRLKENKLSQQLQKLNLKKSPISESKSVAKKSFTKEMAKRYLESVNVKITSAYESTAQSGGECSTSLDDFFDPEPAPDYGLALPPEQIWSFPDVNDGDSLEEDVEMLDVTLDLLNLDDLAEPREEMIFDNFTSYYLVVDTNVFMSELKMIDEIKDTPIEGCGPPHIFIPWIVIQELDALKSKSKNTSKGKAAADAIRYLNSVLKAKHPRFHGQSPQEFVQWAKKYSKCNDDDILECCMGLRDKMPPEKVILLTNDKNLANKALICDIKVHNWKSMMETLKTDVIFKGEELQKKSNKKKKRISDIASNVCTLNKSSGSSKKLDVAQKNEDKTLVSMRNNCKQDIHTLMSNARQLLKQVLDPFLEAEMSAAYGNIWKVFKIETELLSGVLKAIIKYWSSVFYTHFTEKDKRNFDILYQKVRRPEGFFGTKEECLLILTAIEDVFCQIHRRWPDLNAPIEEIQDLRVSCVEAFLKYNEIEKSISSAESQSSLNTFQNNWAVINQLCGMIMDFCELPHDFQYEKPVIFPSDHDFRNLICNLYPSVNQLKQLMASLIEGIQKSAPVYDVIKKFHKALKDFIPSLQIQTEFSPDPYFSVKALQNFCLSLENKEMIQIGFKQLEHFFSKLDEALAVLMSTAFRKKYQEKMMCD